MSSTRFFYLRKNGTRNSEIVGCCAYRKRGGNVVEFAVSCLNQQFDRFDRHEAQRIALDRLNRSSLPIRPTVADTFMNRMKMKVGLVKQTFEPVGNLFDVRQIITVNEGEKPYIALLNEISHLDTTDCPTNLKKAARKMLLNFKKDAQSKSLQITEPETFALQTAVGEGMPDDPKTVREGKHHLVQNAVTGNIEIA